MILLNIFVITSMSKKVQQNLFPILDEGKISQRDSKPKSNFKKLVESFGNSTVSPMQRYKLLTKKFDDGTMSSAEWDEWFGLSFHKDVDLRPVPTRSPFPLPRGIPPLVIPPPPTPSGWEDSWTWCRWTRPTLQRAPLLRNKH